MKELIKCCKIPEEKLNRRIIRMEKVGILISQGNNFVQEHMDPSSGHLVILGGGATRVIFPQDKKEATLTSTGDMVFSRSGEKYRIFSKGIR
eukprot:15176275-Ditylum_brightwellii.AAC.1